MDLLAAVAVSILPRVADQGCERASRTPSGRTRDHPGVAARRDRIPPEDRSRIVSEGLASARVALEAAREHGMEPLPWFEPRYPPLLACVADPPPVLWIKGDAKVLERPAVAIVGSRAATRMRQVAGRWRGAGRAGDRRGERSRQRVDSAAHEGCWRPTGPQSRCWVRVSTACIRPNIRR